MKYINKREIRILKKTKLKRVQIDELLLYDNYQYQYWLMNIEQNCWLLANIRQIGGIIMTNTNIIKAKNITIPESVRQNRLCNQTNNQPLQTHKHNWIHLRGQNTPNTKYTQILNRIFKYSWPRGGSFFFTLSTRKPSSYYIRWCYSRQQLHNIDYNTKNTICNPINNISEL